MQEKTKAVQIRFATQGTIESSAGHQVRTLSERDVCEWLTERGIAHRHATEVLIVKAAANDSPSLFVPDILLTKKHKDGRGIVIETLHNFSPKRGGLKTFAAFCKQYGDKYYSILIAKKSNLESIPKGVCDARVEFENLDTLARKLGAVRESVARAA